MGGGYQYRAFHVENFWRWWLRRGRMQGRCGACPTGQAGQVPRPIGGYDAGIRVQVYEVRRGVGGVDGDVGAEPVVSEGIGPGRVSGGDAQRRGGGTVDKSTRWYRDG